MVGTIQYISSNKKSKKGKKLFNIKMNWHILSSFIAISITIGICIFILIQTINKSSEQEGKQFVCFFFYYIKFCFIYFICFLKSKSYRNYLLPCKTWSVSRRSCSIARNIRSLKNMAKFG